jgi:hypothetical protein
LNLASIVVITALSAALVFGEVKANGEPSPLCLLAATRMIEAIEADIRQRNFDTATIPSSPAERAAEAEKQAAMMDPAGCAMMASAPDSFFIGMARRIGNEIESEARSRGLD